MQLNRRATTLVELIVVLVLGSIVVAIFAHSVTAQRRAERGTLSASTRASVVDEALEVVTSALERVSLADTLFVRGDTALEWRGVIGVAVACAAGGDSVIVADSGSGAWWEVPPDSGDTVELADESGVWSQRVITLVRARASGGVCGVAQRTLRLRAALIAPSSSGTLNASVPLVRVTRRSRFMLYKGGDGAWWLGTRTCDDALPPHCDSAQPVTGPLAPPPTGMRFSIDSTAARRRVTVQVSAGTLTRSATVDLRP